jgi:hypothetical protein
MVLGCAMYRCRALAVTSLRILLVSAALTLVTSFPATAWTWVKPDLVCDGIDSWFETRTLGPVELMCLTQRLQPGNGSTTRNEFDASPLIGRRVSVMFEVDTYNTSEDSHWSYDPSTGSVEIRVSGDRLSPDMFLTQDADDGSWWKRAGELHGLMVRTDLLDGPDGHFVVRTVYLAEVGMPKDPARLGAYPFLARMGLSPEDAARVRQDVVFEADGAIVATKGLSALHCGDLSVAKWKDDSWGSPTKNCVISVQFDYFALRLVGGGQILSEWRRGQ